MKINITFINPLGTFSGILEQDELSKTEAQETVNMLIKNVGKITHLGVRADDGSEIVLNEQQIRNSVIKFKIVE